MDKLEEFDAPDSWYAPVFILNEFRFVWYDRALVAETPEAAKKIGLKLESGYIENDVPIAPARFIAKFRSSGSYAIASMGPEGDERPIIVINPMQVDGAGQAIGAPDETKEQVDPVEEIAYDLIEEGGFVKSVSF